MNELILIPAGYPQFISWVQEIHSSSYMYAILNTYYTLLLSTYSTVLYLSTLQVTILCHVITIQVVKNLVRDFMCICVVECGV